MLESSTPLPSICGITRRKLYALSPLTRLCPLLTHVAAQTQRIIRIRTALYNAAVKDTLPLKTREIPSMVNEFRLERLGELQFLLEEQQFRDEVQRYCREEGTLSHGAAAKNKHSVPPLASHKSRSVANKKHQLQASSTLPTTTSQAGMAGDAVGSTTETVESTVQSSAPTNSYPAFKPSPLARPLMIDDDMPAAATSELDTKDEQKSAVAVTDLLVSLGDIVSVTTAQVSQQGRLIRRLIVTKPSGLAKIIGAEK